MWLARHYPLVHVGGCIVLPLDGKLVKSCPELISNFGDTTRIYSFIAKRPRGEPSRPTLLAQRPSDQFYALAKGWSNYAHRRLPKATLCLTAWCVQLQLLFLSSDRHCE